MNLAGPSLLSWAVHPQDLRKTSAAITAAFVLRHAADDSWKPMLLALDEAHGPRADRIYRTLFFERKIKFQYPPSSLLSLDLAQSLSSRAIDLRWLNNLSWLCVLALGVLVPATYRVCLKQWSPDVWRRFTPLDLRVQTAALCLMTLSFYPIVRGYALGQIQTWLTCLFAGAVLAWACGRQALSGVLIGLIVTVKPQLGLLLVWGAVQRRRRFVVGASAVVLILELLSLWRYGLGNHIDYLAVLSYLSAHGESFFANQSVNGLLARLLHVGNNVTWEAQSFPPYHPVVYFGTVVSSCAMVALALFWRPKRRGEETSLVQFVIAALLLTMASPIAWEHHYGVLAPAYAVLLAAFLKDLPNRTWLACLGGTCIVSANTFPFANLAAATPWNFVQSYLFAASALLIAIVYGRDRAFHQSEATITPSARTPAT